MSEKEKRGNKEENKAETQGRKRRDNFGEARVYTPCPGHYDFSGLCLDPPLRSGIESKYAPHLPMAVTSHTEVECGYDVCTMYQETYR